LECGVVILAVHGCGVLTSWATLQHVLIPYFTDEHGTPHSYCLRVAILSAAFKYYDYSVDSFKKFHFVVYFFQAQAADGSY